jgi:hypothetical protein
MSRYGKCVSTGAVVVAGYGVMVWAMGMMNRTSDRALYAGMAVILAVVVRGRWWCGGFGGGDGGKELRKKAMGTARTHPRKARMGRPP